MRRSPFVHSPAQTPSQRDAIRRSRRRQRALAVRPERMRDGVPKALFPPRRTLRPRGVQPSGEIRGAPDKAVPPPPAAAVVALTRTAFGPRPGDVEAFDALGATDAERLAAYVDRQLDPAAIDDSAAEARIAESGFETLGKSLEDLWQEHALAEDWEVHMQPFWETQLATFLRAIHSERQLFEVMAGFWHDHFSVFADDSPHGSVWVHSDRDAIRAHALGNFRQLLEAVARTPAMLFYLDNAFNSSEDANENYGRELLELHTLGADAYLGSLPPDQVPVDGDGWPVGWVEDDVVGAARCLTGWTVDSDWVHWEFGQSGTFLYWDEWHDHDPKTVIGLDLPAGQPPMADGRDLLDRLCRHPATGHHLATKLCRRLLGDSPPPAVVDAAAAVFTDHWQDGDQIARVVRTILLAPEFLATWGDKVKRPFQIAVSSFRGAGGDLPFRLGDGVTEWFYWEYYQTGQPLFSWHPPNGYPDFKAAWNTTAPRVMCWRLANFFVQVWDEDDEVPYFDLLAQTPAEVLSASALVEFWSRRILGRALPAGDEQTLVVFMAQGAGPFDDLPLRTDWETQERLRAMVALILMSPSFLWR